MRFFGMNTKEVIKKAGDYMRGILADSNAIREKYQQINYLKMELALPTAASVANYTLKIGDRYKDIHSPTTGAIERRARLEKELAAELDKAKNMEADLFHVMLSLQHKMILTHIDEWNVLEMLYFKGMTLSEAGRKMNCSKAMINTIKNVALLSIGSVVLDLRADGEYYDEKGLYINFTAGQKKRIMEGITLY